MRVRYFFEIVRAGQRCRAEIIQPKTVGAVAQLVE